MAGLTSTGFVPLTLAEIRTELEDALRVAFGASIDVSASSPFGQLIGIVAEREALLWELAEAIYNSLDEAAATGAALDALCALTGTLRAPAEGSTVTITCTGDDATVIPFGKQVSVDDTGEVFQVITDSTNLITTVAAWGATTAYVVGDRVSNGGTIRVYQCITAGTSAGSGGPTTTSADITDNTVHWRYLGEGEGATDLEALSVNTGAIVGVSGSITTIETPVSGWESVINILDAAPGNDLETDAELRVRRREEIRGGTRHIESILEAVLAVDDVTSAKVFENTSLTTDGDGLPGKAIEVLVLGGDDVEIAQAIWDNVADGILPHGTSSETITDSQGTEYTVGFSRPDEIDIYIDIELTYDASLFPADGDDQIKAIIVANGDLGYTGLNVVASRIKSWCFGVPGVLDVTVAQIDDAPAPTVETTLAIGTRELAVYDTSRITVVSTPATP